MRDERDLDEMKQSLNTIGSGAKIIARRRFDFVIGNPPYISYNDCAKKLKTKIIRQIQDKNSSIKMNDIFGFNLNTVPGRRKTYPPKPNLYAFFIALGIALLKEGAVMSYIIPQTILTANDLDVLRYIFSNEVTLQKMFIFSGSVFLNRGIDQKKPIATSSLIFVLKKKKPEAKNQVEIYVDSEISKEKSIVVGKLLDELIIIAKELDADQIPYLYEVMDNAEEVLDGLKNGEIDLVSNKEQKDE